MKIKAILAKRDRGVHSIGAEATVLEAVGKMTEDGIGSLIVVDGSGAIAGIVTERDCMQEVARDCSELSARHVSDILTKDVVVGSLDSDLQEIVDKMTATKCRHIPIVAGGKPIGMISARDVVRSLLTERTSEVEMLQEYLRHP